MKKPVSLHEKKPVAAHDKYFLRDLHQEIDLYDRKLEYMNRYEEFASPADRAEAAKKLQTKRAQLEKRARELAASGVEFAEQELPRSFRAAGEHAGSVAMAS